MSSSVFQSIATRLTQGDTLHQLATSHDYTVRQLKLNIVDRMTDIENTLGLREAVLRVAAAIPVEGYDPGVTLSNPLMTHTIDELLDMLADDYEKLLIRNFDKVVSPNATPRTYLTEIIDVASRVANAAAIADRAIFDGDWITNLIYSMGLDIAEYDDDRSVTAASLTMYGLADLDAVRREAKTAFGRARGDMMIPCSQRRHRLAWLAFCAPYERLALIMQMHLMRWHERACMLRAISHVGVDANIPPPPGDA